MASERSEGRTTGTAATFSPPIKATADRDSLPRIVVAVRYDETGRSFFLCIDGDGRSDWIDSDGVTFDWRFDPILGWGDVPVVEEDDG